MGCKPFHGSACNTCPLSYIRVHANLFSPLMACDIIIQFLRVGLSRKVFGELVSFVTGKECAYELPIYACADHPDHLVLFRKYVSRKALGKGQAILEGVGLDSNTIVACFNSHPMNEEAAVQAGLVKWCGGQSHKPSSWDVLIYAMEYALIPQQDIWGLMEELGMFGMLFYNNEYYICGIQAVCTCMQVCVQWAI